ncbi:hypothetical protein B0T20DRAFT_353899 [Sordaria brevicollis]|uniref:SWIM-type domain-containing protein n=1 Tax=Sordaria brevicollis TaxID=83679 RepID=A0AAE0PF61_SORBR|nr:hypothetical protein B0T20DRAFT_353899 [Sordaria brevicollis]
MEIQSRDDLERYLPDDAPWEQYPRRIINVQCIRRGDFDNGPVSEVIQRLHEFRGRYPGEERLLPWLVRSDKHYKTALRRARYRRYQVLSVEDNSDHQKTSIEKLFTLWEPVSDTEVYVIISRILRCSCSRWKHQKGRETPTCDHIIYVLLYVLNCPEPLRWQQAFLTKELKAIFEYSTAFDYRHNLAFPPNNTQCVRCFRDLAEQDYVVYAHCCRAWAHPECREIGREAENCCILQLDALDRFGSRQSSLATWSHYSSSPPRVADADINQPQEIDEDDNNRSDSISDDRPTAANDEEDSNSSYLSASRSVQFFKERSRLSLDSSPVGSSTSSDDSVVIKQEPESPCPPPQPSSSPRRQMPSRAAKEAVRARPDAYTGYSPRKQALTPVRPWSPRVSTTPIPLPVLSGYSQPIGGSQSPRRAQTVVPAPVVSPSAQGRAGTSMTVGRGSPLRIATAAIPSPSPAYLSPPARHEVDPFVSLPPPPTGALFASVLIRGGDVGSSIDKKKKTKKTKMSKKDKKMSKSEDITTGHASDQANVDDKFPPEVKKLKASKLERRKARLIKRVIRLQDRVEKAREKEKHVQWKIARLEKKKSKVAGKIDKLFDKSREKKEKKAKKKSV